MMAESPSSNHQTVMDIELNNAKRMCDSIKYLVKNVLFDQFATLSEFNIFKECLYKEVLHQQSCVKMIVELSLLKTSFVKTQSDVILEQYNIALLAHNKSDSLLSISSRVDALDVKVFDKSSFLYSLDKRMSNMVSDLNVIFWVKDCAAKKMEEEERRRTGAGSSAPLSHPISEEQENDILEKNIDNEQ